VHITCIYCDVIVSTERFTPDEREDERSKAERAREAVHAEHSHRLQRLRAAEQPGPDL